MTKYHGIIVDASMKDKRVPRGLKILGRKRSTSEDWMLYKVEVSENDFEAMSKNLQSKMVAGGYYFHFYRDDELIVCYKDKIFKISPEKSTWKSAIDYGKSLNIPVKQLDFQPSRIRDETY
ncbi:MAG: hypothetical protein Q8R08_04615 [bacterium]|nr:hypothetical protein [bacterium]